MRRMISGNQSGGSQLMQQSPAALGKIATVMASTEPQREIFLAVHAGGDAANLAYNESMLVPLNGEVNLEAFAWAYEQLLYRHDALRITFNRYGTQVLVHREVEPNFRFVDLRNHSDSVAALEALRAEAVSTPFDLQQGPLVRGVLAHVENGRYAAILTFHHIICDGWSLSLLLSDLAELYTARSQGRPAELPGVPSFVEYLHVLASDAYKYQAAQDEIWWMQQYSQGAPVLELPTDFVRPAVRTFHSKRIDHLLPVSLVSALKKTGIACQSSLVATVLTGFATFLHRLSGQTDFVIGMPAAGQSIENMEMLVGHCVNTLPIRCRIHPDHSFVQNLQGVRDGLLDTYDHQRLTFGSLVARLGLARDPSRVPLVPILFNIDPGMKGLKFGDIASNAVSNPRVSESFEWFLNATESRDPAGNKGALLLECQYNTDLYSESTVTHWLGVFEQLLQQITEHRDVPVSLLKLTSAQDAALWREMNATQMPLPAHTSLHGWLKETAANRTDAFVQFGAERITHAELWQRAGRLARALHEQGVRAGDFVGLCMDRSLDMLVALLGILRAGAGYIPLDPSYPADRLNHMITDSGLKTLVLRGALPAGLQTDALAAQIDMAAPAFLNPGNFSSQEDAEGCCVDVGRQSPAYMIYTSGSTGLPKGVQVQHGAVVNFLASMAKAPGLTVADHLLAVTTISFDIAVLELWLPLVVGANLTIATREQSMDGYQLRTCLEQNGITLMQATPSSWRLLLAADWQGGAGFKVLTGGEALPPSLANQLLARVGELWNLYGPTETTVWSTVSRVLPDTQITLGRPIANTQIAIIDEHRNATPVGVAGELIIGGSGVTLGYWKRPELNQDRFIHWQGQRYYRTGDLARLTADGQLIYQGRSDFQVKLRGYRIELGEIEAQLNEAAGIAEAIVVVLGETEDDQRLVAFYRRSASSSESVSNKAREGAFIASLRGHLAAHMPAFMIPQQWVEVQQMPLTPNGKVDRKALKLPKDATDALSGLSVEAVASSADEEKNLSPSTAKILGMMRKFLQNPALRPTDDFFQNGGHSLLGMRILAELNKVLPATFGLTDLFQAPSAGALGARWDLAHAGNVEAEVPALSIPVHVDRSRFRMSLQQRRIWFLEQLDGGGIEYSLPASWRFHGALQRDALAGAVDQLVARHASLRTILLEDEGVLLQRVVPATAGNLKIYDVPGESEEARWAVVQTAFDERRQRPFRMGEETLFRADLFCMGAEDHTLCIVVHHAVFDGWSFDILLSDLSELYNAAVEMRKPSLPVLPVQYGDFSEWMLDRAQNADRKALDYWLGSLAGELPVLELPTKAKRPELQSHAGAGLHFEIDAQTMARVSEFSRRQGVTLFMTMIAVFKLLMWRYSGQRDLIVGVPVSGRNYAEINALIGFFVNTIALRDSVNPDQSVADWLQAVRQTCLQGFAYQETPFEKIVEHLNPTRDLSRSAVFQVIFAYQDITNRQEAFHGLRREQVNIDRAGVQTDVDFWMKWTGSSMHAGFEYASDLFDANFIARLQRDFVALVTRVTDFAAKPVSALCDLPDPERDAALTRLNSTSMLLPTPLLVHAQFSLQAARTPNATATMYHCGASQDSNAKIEDSRFESLSYAQLESRSNRIAHWLVSAGVKSGDRVGVAVSPSLWLQAVLLGVLKSGATYIPIDPKFPVERIRYMISNSSVGLLVHDGALTSELRGNLAGARSVAMRELEGELDQQSDQRLDISLNPESGAYIIYTSGSTGLPKGVVISHRAMVNYLAAVAQRPGFSAQDRILAATTLSFDIAVTELFLPLVTGGASVLVDRDLVVDVDQLHPVMAAAGVTLYQATPSSWRLLLGTNWQGGQKMRAWVGGEALPSDLIEKLLPKVAEVWNVYGPTETTVWSTCHQVRSTQEAGIIGLPLGNTSCYVLGDQHTLKPLGVMGELYIGGKGVASGYFNRADLTAERFIPNPFGDGLLYATGDQARLLAGGLLECGGRLDHQVKVRGYRIELAEIELALLQHPQIAQAVAIAKAFGEGDARLVAYIVPRDGTALEFGALAEFLQAHVPVYMIPQHFVVLDAIPMTPNQKVDRKALPSPEVEQKAAIVPPSSATELALHEIWAQAMRQDAISIDGEFFALGGHSLLAVEIIRRVRQQFGVDMPLAVLFSHPTIRRMASFVDIHRPAEEVAPEVINQASAKPAAENEWSNLVALRAEGTHAPLFCFHPVGGNVLHYAALLPRIPEHWPVYGLQATGLNGIAPPLSDVEQMAKQYLNEIRKVQAHGPYWLSGGSSGGLLALEVARLLVEEGEQVARLMLFDTIGPQRATDEQSRIEGRKFKNPLKQIQHSIAVRLSDGIRVLRCRWANLFRQEIEHELRYWWIQRHNYQAMTRYLQSARSRLPYEGAVDLFRLPSRERGVYSLPLIGWDDTLVGKVRTYIVDGEHAHLIEAAEFGEQLSIAFASVSEYVQTRISESRERPQTASVERPKAKTV
ncbi:Probable peptide synthetase protein [gamma proteobacterium HdN1]|nr:Probable peptide synthetase protein [gamma proteobacterium HdN1]